VAKAKKKSRKLSSKTSSRLKDLAGNPVVTDLAAAALVSAAAAIKNPPEARARAAGAQDELTALARDGARKGASLWKLAMDFGRQALDTLVGDPKPARKSDKATAKPAAKVARKAAKPAAKTARKSAKPAAKTARKSAKTAAKTARKSASRGKPRAK
jgi:hypothetical protein